MTLRGQDIEQFGAFLSLRGCKPSTVKRHITSITKVLGSVHDLTAAELDSYFASLLSKGLKATYCNSLLNSIIVFCHYQGKPLTYPKFKETEFIKATMSDDEIEAFLTCPKSKNCSPEHYQIWTLFFSIMAYTGMRPGEVAHLKIQDVDFGRGVFSIEEGKTGHRLVPIPKLIESALADHLGGLQTDFLFPSQRGKGVVDSVDWGYNFHCRINRMGIVRKNLSPYSLRHSLITRLLEEDVNLFKVQKIVGHRDMRTTAHYTHMTTKDIQMAIQKHPLIRRASDPKLIIQHLVSLIETFNLREDTRFQFVFEQTEDSLKLEAKIRGTQS